MREIAGQFVRFGLTGVVSTAIYALVYLALTSLLLPRELAVVAVLPAFVVAVAFSFLANARWGFRDRAEAARPGQSLRFFIAQSAGFALNLGFTWLVTAAWGQAPWVALIPCVTITPLVTFALVRWWVFA